MHHEILFNSKYLFEFSFQMYPMSFLQMYVEIVNDPHKSHEDKEIELREMMREYFRRCK